jgi:hypothetical protein
MQDIQQVTPEIDVDELTGFPEGYKMIFQIKSYQVRAEVLDEYGEETQYSIIIRGIYNEQTFGHKPNADDAQTFLYKTIIDGIFITGDFEVVAK